MMESAVQPLVALLLKEESLPLHSSKSNKLNQTSLYGIEWKLLIIRVCTLTASIPLHRMTPLPLLEFKYMLKKLPSSKALRRATSSKSRIPSDLSRRFLPNVNEMREVFDKIDRDRDGKISKKELGQVLSAMRDQDMSDLAGEMVKVADLNGDGRIDFEEFMEVNRKWGGVSAWEIKKAFFLYDFDGDGRIGAEDLEKMLTRLGEKSSPEACQKMVRCVDRTGHGLVDMDDFMTMMTKSMKTASAV